MKLTSLQTVLRHSWCVARTASVMALASAVGASMPQRGLTYGASFDTIGTTASSFARDHAGTTGWSDTAFVTIVVTSGTRPASADITKLVDPWQCTTALTSEARVSSMILRTAAG